MNVRNWLQAAEVFDSWRVVPRVVLFSYCGWVAHVTDAILLWYQHIPAAERSTESAAFCGAVITAVTGLAVWVYKIYSENGRDWAASQPTSQTETVVAQTKTVKGK